MSDIAPAPSLMSKLASDENSRSTADQIQRIRLYAAALLLFAIPALGTKLAHLGPAANPTAHQSAGFPIVQAQHAPPVVDPVAIKTISHDDARTINAAIPFSKVPNPAARPFHFSGSSAALERAVDCLAAAQYFEAGDNSTGQKAVAQVVLNRVRHPAFPKSVCSVVFQGTERTSGCQFTFTCDGALGRTPPAAAWKRARTLARSMLMGRIERKVGYATHYHTDWVVPYWSNSLDKVSEVHTHLFFRWPGQWGKPGAFLKSVRTSEPTIAKLARLSPAHREKGGPVLDLSPEGLKAPQMRINAVELAEAPKQYDGSQSSSASSTGKARLVATSPQKDAFIIALPRGMATGDYLATAQTFCAGRPKCRIMGWHSDAPPPTSFPVPRSSLPNMRFSYIHNAQSGLQRLLWNCDMVPQDNPRNCMRERIPVAELLPPAKP